MKAFKTICLSVIFIMICTGASHQSVQSRPIKVNPKEMRHMCTVDDRFQSYNIGMAEVIGGKCWKPYSRMVYPLKDFTTAKAVMFDTSLFQNVSPLNFSDNRLQRLAAALGPVYLRISGTCANSVYFQDNDKAAMNPAPAGFRHVLTRKQWKGVVDFANAIDARIVTSFAICSGVRNKLGNWTPAEAIKVLNYTKSIGGSIYAAEFFQQPNIAIFGGAPRDYCASMYLKDIQEFRKFIKSSAPEMILAGPGNVGEGAFELPSGMEDLTTGQIFSGSQIPAFDVFSYHFYGAISQRFAGLTPVEFSTSSEDALAELWFNRAVKAYQYFKEFHDRYLWDTPIWITETADALYGGNPWSETFLDCFRYLEQLGRMARNGVQVVMHNSLTSGEYSLLDQDTHMPKPNYWAALLWSNLMGNEVYDAEKGAQGVDLFAHSMKSHPDGISLMIINTNQTTASIQIPCNAEQYTLTSDKLQGKTIFLNGDELQLGSDDALPSINGKPLKPGIVELPSLSISFLTFADVTKQGLDMSAINGKRNINMSEFKNIELNIPYTTSDNLSQTLDIVYPSIGKPPYKTIVLIHGGGWSMGNKECESIAPVFQATGQGYAVVSINYRLSDEVKWPAQLHDAKAAIRFIRKNGSKYQLDTRKIVVWGCSAGGQLAEMLGATNNLPAFEDLSMGNPESSSAVQGIVAWYPISDLTRLTNHGMSAACALMGFDVNADSIKTANACPINLVTKNFPAILLVHGTKDDIVPYWQSIEMQRKIKDQTSKQPRLVTFEGAYHGDPRIRSIQNVMNNLAFVDSILFNGGNPYRNKKYLKIKSSE